MLKDLSRQFDIRYDYPLQEHNSFGLPAKALAYVAVTSVPQLQAIVKAYRGRKFVLGGGSNLLLIKDIDALVIHNRIDYKTIVREFPKSVYAVAGGGTNWHQFVLWAIQEGYGGIENLSLIPGTVGAAPIQNIGAYGVELSDVFHQLKAVDLSTGAIRLFKRKDCVFGYRDSIFKRQYKGRFCVCEVTLKLSRFPKVNTSYGAIRQTLQDMNVVDPGIADVSKAVIRIRSSKLPDPASLGNAGSFFKNPEVGQRRFYQLLKTHPSMPYYPLPNGKTKIPAGWLIEQCGWKGYRRGDAGCHRHQALVLVNYGNATGSEIDQLAKDIAQSVVERFGIRLEREVGVVG